MNYLNKAKEFDKIAISRLITILENYGDKHRNIYNNIFKEKPKSIIIGVTGPPGAGKSTLVDKMVKELIKNNKKVGVIAIDPTSVFSGGAILGDRVRMTELSTNPNVFIRSMATRGALGGISKSAFAAVKVLNYAGFDYVFIETVGVGQSEIDIASIADLVLVVAVPGLGDDIQAIKAGIMEIGDVFALNKADLDGVDIAYMQIKKSFEINSVDVPLVKVSASKCDGIVELINTLDTKYQSLLELGQINERRRFSFKSQLISFINSEITFRVDNHLKKYGGIEKIVEKFEIEGIDPYTTCRDILKNIDFKE